MQVKVLYEYFESIKTFNLQRNAHSLYSHTVSLNTFKLYSHCSQKCFKHDHGCKKTVRTNEIQFEQCLLRPVRPDQSEQMGLFRRGALKRHIFSFM